MLPPATEDVTSTFSIMLGSQRRVKFSRRTQPRVGVVEQFAMTLVPVTYYSRQFLYFRVSSRFMQFNLTALSQVCSGQPYMRVRTWDMHLAQLLGLVATRT